MNFTDLLWEDNRNCFNAMVSHPFNQELMRGTLSHERFVYYIYQDSFYLKEFSKALALISTRIDEIFRLTLLNFSRDALLIEHEVVHQYYLTNIPSTSKFEISPTTFVYTNFLLKTASLDSIFEACAAVLPCFWVYSEVGKMIHVNSYPNNPYQSWIDTYASQEFSDQVEEMIAIVEALSQHQLETTKQKIKHAFNTSFQFELKFWDDAYNMGSTS